MKKTLIIVVIVAVIGIFYLSSDRETESIYDTTIAEKSDLIQKINTTGRIEAVSQTNLAFLKSGRVSNVYVEIGDSVKAGQKLIELADREDQADLAQAYASVESAVAILQQYEASLSNQKAILDELRLGAREEEILLYESKVQNAEIVLQSVQENATDVMYDSYTRSEDIIKNKVDNIFENPTAQNIKLKFSTTNSQLNNEILVLRTQLQNSLPVWKSQLDTSEDINSSLTFTKENLENIKVFLEKISIILNVALINQEVTQTTLDLWKIDISTARTRINTAITNYGSVKEKFKAAEIALIIAENELSLKTVNTLPQQISAQTALITQAEASISAARADIKYKQSVVEGSKARLANNTLRSAISGIVTKQSAKEGAIVNANQEIITIISEGTFEIETLIVEADIVGLEIGDEALLTLDAYGEDEEFTAVVTKINPAAEFAEGVASYRTTLLFTNMEDRNIKLRAGMTADIDLTTEEQIEVIAIPGRAVIFKSDKKIVRVLSDDILNEVEVEIGITGERGYIEIISGIEEGDIIITAIND